MQYLLHVLQSRATSNREWPQAMYDRCLTSTTFPRRRHPQRGWLMCGCSLRASSQHNLKVYVPDLA